LAEIERGDPPRRHEVVEPLATAIQRHRLPIEAFLELIEAREQDLDGEPPADLAQLTRYAEATSGTLVRIALAVLGKAGPATEPAGRDVGIAYALAGLIRAIPFHARMKRLYLPVPLLEAHRVDRGEVFELRSSPGLRDAVRELADLAGSHLDRARDLGPVPRRALPALLPATLAELYLRRIAKLGYEVFDPALAEPPPLALWRMGWRALRGRF
jgi:phytoene synthase